MAHPPWPAKLSAPKADRLVARERLLARLDRCLDRAHCVWITAPAGAGKTSLAASWLDTRRLGHTWYRVDAGDGDPATFIHYLRQAAQRDADRPPSSPDLPVFAAAFLPALDIFALRFFEAFFSRRAAPHVLVLDSFHEAPAESPFAAMVAAALQARPTGVLLLCCSRGAPPAALARWRADDGFVELDADALRLTDDEAHALCRQAGAAGYVDAARINARARGWATGFKLLLQGSASATPPESRPQAIFDLLATEVFGRASDALQDFLLRSSCLPTMTPSAVASITNRADAELVLEQLQRSGQFTERRHGGPAAIYEYHPLFRDFLLERARQRFSPAEWAQTLHQAGLALERGGEVESAWQAFADAGEWTEVERLVTRHAQTLIEHGRMATVERWISALTPARVESNGWLTMWLGVCRSMQDPAGGLVLLERAYLHLREVGDRHGMFAALGNIIGWVMFAWLQAKAIEPWIAEFERLLTETGGVIPEEMEVGLLGACHGLVITNPAHPVLQHLVPRALALGPRVADPGQRYSIGMLCVTYLVWHGRVTEALQTAEVLTAAQTHEPMTWQRILFDTWYALALMYSGEAQRQREVAAQAIAHAERIGLVVALPQLYTQLAFAALHGADAKAAHAALDAGWPAPAPWHAIDLQSFRILRAAAFVHEGRDHEARELLGTIQAQWIEGPAPAIAIMRSTMGAALALVGRHDDARVALQRVLDDSRAQDGTTAVWLASMALAWCHFDNGDEAQGLAMLRQAMALGAAHRFRTCHPPGVPRMLADLMAHALDHGIEPEYTRQFIRWRQLACPPDRPDLEAWPRRVRIRALGSLQVLIDDQPLAVTGRGPRKPLELLACIIAHGGHDVPLAALLDELWPDQDGADAYNACNVALHRLRKLLGHGEAAVTVHAGRVNLQGAQVWVDTWSLERLLQRIEGRGTHHVAGPLPGLPRAVLDLYRGRFLAGEDAPWAAQPRDRLHARVLQACLAEGTAREARSRWDEASEIYGRLLDIDPTIETGHQGLIRCLMAQGRHVEARQAFERCRKTLNATLGIDPSPWTRACLTVGRG